jgi:hypothetical protein
VFWENVAFGIFPPQFAGQHNLLPKVLLTSAKRLEGEDALLVLRLRMCGMYLHLPWRFSSLLCNSVFYSVPYCSVCRDEIKNEPKKSNRRGFSFGEGVGQIHDVRTWSYADLETLFNTLQGTVTFSVMTLFRSGVSSPSQFTRLILRQPRARVTDILTTSREDVFVCDRKQKTLLYTGI